MVFGTKFELITLNTLSMKKLLVVLSLFVAVGFTQNVQAQQTREVSVAINKANQTAVAADFNYKKEALEAVLKNRLANAKLGKSKSASKFTKFEGVNWNEVSPDKMDVYYRVSGKKDKSTVEFLVSKGYDNFVTSANDPATIANLKNFIASLEQDLIKYSIDELIAAKEKDIKAAEKTVDSKKGDVSKAEKELEKAKAEVKKQEDTVSQLKAELDKLKAQK